MKIYSIQDKEFAKYGRVIDAPYFDELKKASETIPVPEAGSMYRASEPAFDTPKINAYYKQVFGEMDVQVGYCWGRNNILNALEWHKNSEISVALTDLIMLLGDMSEMKDGKFESKKLKAFLFKEGESAELFATTLHFCPGMAKDKVFKNVVVLPKGTNLPLENESDDKFLHAKNKWIIVHPDFKRLVEMGRVVGIVGKNIKIK